MMISMFFVLLAVPWAFGLVSSFGVLVKYTLGLAILVMMAHLITLVTVTMQRAQLSKHAAWRSTGKAIMKESFSTG